MTTRIPFINSLTDNSGSAWDQLRLGGFTVPGAWTCEVSKKRDLMIVKLRLRDGVGILDNGYFGVALELSGRIWTPDQWYELQDQFPNYDPPRQGGSRSPLYVYHPAAAFLGVSLIYIAEFKLPPPSGGILPLSIGAVQWFPRPKPFIQGFAGTRRSGAPINSTDFDVPPPSKNGPPP